MEVAGLVGEAFLRASFAKLFYKLSELKFLRQKTFRAELKKWGIMLLKIQAVLEDAEEQKTTSRHVEIWLSELRDLVYDVEDILDELATELALQQRQLEQSITRKVRKFLPTSFTISMFNVKAASKMKKISTRLEDISAITSTLNLREDIGGRSTRKTDRQPTTSLPESLVYGRDDDKEAVLGMLLVREASDAVAGVSVIPIQGMGGVGKTTLAQLIYGDDRAKHFEPKAWVCVSDTLDVLSITKSILVSTGADACDGKDLNWLQVKLKETLSRKKFLIVLDDVWNVEYEDWTSLCKPFQSGLQGSTIIVTTRHGSVSSTLGTVQPYHLKEVSYDDCLSIFAQHALKTTNFDGHPNLKSIGVEIVKKCQGLPLAAKTLGGLLYNKLKPEEWVQISESKVWDLPHEERGILPALRLSYHYLPSHLKQCFAYCAIFPKDYEFDKDELVLLWMAEGFLQQKKGNKRMEDLGAEYFSDLLSRSLFQQSRQDGTRFVMHDLIHDLAQYVAEGICVISLDANPSAFQRARHLSFTRCSYEVSTRFEVLSEAKGVRTFLPLYALAHKFDRSCISDVALNTLILKLKCLRALSLNGYRISEVPQSVGNLKLLRYLDLSRTDIKQLPEWISSLLNLQSLILRGCKVLEKLPTNIENLINLRHLDIRGTPNLKEMPVGIGNLARLQNLTQFIVGGGNGLKLRELKKLFDLRGELSICCLNNVEDLQDAREADLEGKQGLEGLVMKWKDNFNEPPNGRVAMDILELLKPPKTLKRLTIKGYCGTGFPSWIGDPSFMSNVVQLQLYKCRESTSLPSLGRLSSLKQLHIKRMGGIKTVGFEFYGCDSPFPSLESLKFEQMFEWEEWSSLGKLPCLLELEILNCPKLIWKLNSRLPSLKKLTVCDCPLLVAEGPVSLPSLRELKLENCNEALLGNMINLTSLTTLRIDHVAKFSCLHKSLVQFWVALEDLQMYNCEDLKSLWQSGTQVEENLTCLKGLKVKSCPRLATLADARDDEDDDPCGGGNELPSNIEYLEIENCGNLEKLPKGLDKLASLRKMILRKCSKLEPIKLQEDEISFSLVEALPERMRHLELEDCGEVTKALLSGMMMVQTNKSLLEHLKIGSCDSLKQFPTRRGKLPSSLKHLTIRDCFSLEEALPARMMLEDDSSSVAIEVLEIVNCLSLTSFPVLAEGTSKLCAVKKLVLSGCAGLDSLPQGIKFHNSTSSALEDIRIELCPNLKSLPDCLHSLTNLTSLQIWSCYALESFPETGLPIPKLKSLQIWGCQNLKTLPNNMHSLTSLEHLILRDCQCVNSFPKWGLPPNLTSLEIEYCENMEQPMSEWGLHKLTSLRDFRMSGLHGLPELELVSFPKDECMLPTTLTSISIGCIGNLESLSSRGFRKLTSLARLDLEFCPKLQYLPNEGLPPTLESLRIIECPILKQKCLRGEGKYWPVISLIPYVKMG